MISPETLSHGIVNNQINLFTLVDVTKYLIWSSRQAYEFYFENSDRSKLFNLPVLTIIFLLLGSYELPFSY